MLHNQTLVSVQGAVAHVRTLLTPLATHSSIRLPLPLPDRSVDGGPLPIDLLMGVETVHHWTEWCDSIDLADWNLGAASAVIIGACIKGNRYLREINLCHNRLRVRGANALAAAIRDSVSVTSVCVCVPLCVCPWNPRAVVVEAGSVRTAQVRGCAGQPFPQPAMWTR